MEKIINAIDRAATLIVTILGFLCITGITVFGISEVFIASQEAWWHILRGGFAICFVIVLIWALASE